MFEAAADTSIQHPDNLLNTGYLPTQLEAKLHNDGIRFVTELQNGNGQRFLLCGQRCPTEAGAEMLRDALRVSRASQDFPDAARQQCVQRFGWHEANHLFGAEQPTAEPV